MSGWLWFGTQSNWPVFVFVISTSFWVIDSNHCCLRDGSVLILFNWLIYSVWLMLIQPCWSVKIFSPRCLEQSFSSFPNENVWCNIKIVWMKKNLFPEHEKSSTCTHMTPIKFLFSCHVNNAGSVTYVLLLLSVTSFSTLVQH